MSSTYWKRKNAGVCVFCGAPPIFPGKLFCATCAELHNKSMQQYRNKLYLRRKELVMKRRNYIHGTEENHN